VRDHHRRYHKQSSSSGQEEAAKAEEALLNDLHPGFLLKRFENENDFANFQEGIYDNVTNCGFADFIDGGEYAEDDDNFIGIFREENHNKRKHRKNRKRDLDAIFNGNGNGDGDVNGDDDDYAYEDDMNSIGDDDDDLKLLRSSSYYDRYYDENLATGEGVIDGGGDAGIFLSMKNREHMWEPNTPSLEHKFTVYEAGFYFLFYQICLTPQSSNSNDNSKFIFKEITSNFKLDFHYMNIDTFGKVSYLTAGEMPLPHMFMYFTISYIILLVMWLQSMKRDMSVPVNNASGSSGAGFGGGPKPTIYAIHHLMSAVVFLKILTLLFESIRYHYIRVNGQADIWSFMYYIINFIKGTFLFTVILLIGSGWSFFKPFLTTKERRVILFVIVLQIIDNIAITILTHETENERLYNDWSTVLHLVDIISCCAILLPIVWQVNTLEESVDAGTGSSSSGGGEGVSDTVQDLEESSSSSSSPQNSRLQSKLDLFRSFYLIVVAYIYFTRIVIYLFASSLKYNQTWIRYFVYELGTLTFYFLVGMKLRPVAEVHSYTQLQNDGNGGGGDDGDDSNVDNSNKGGGVEMSTVRIMSGVGKVAKD